MGPKQIALYHRYCELRDRIDRNVALGNLPSKHAIYRDEKGIRRTKRLFPYMDRKWFERSMTENDMKACEEDLTVLGNELFLLDL